MTLFYLFKIQEHLEENELGIKRIQISKSDVQEELGIDYSSTHLEI